MSHCKRSSQGYPQPRLQEAPVKRGLCAGHCQTFLIKTHLAGRHQTTQNPITLIHLFGPAASQLQSEPAKRSFLHLAPSAFLPLA